jgi:hypothetical protein
MARRDYVCCSVCGDKMFYDGKNVIRAMLEIKYGSINDDIWTVGLTCPDCLKKAWFRVGKMTVYCEQNCWYLAHEDGGGEMMEINQDALEKLLSEFYKSSF